MAKRQTIEVDGRTISVIRKRQKNIYLRISLDGIITVTAPTRTSLAYISSFVRSKERWIERRAHEVATRREADARFAHDGTTVFVWGEPLTVTVREGAREDFGADAQASPGDASRTSYGIRVERRPRGATPGYRAWREDDLLVVRVYGTTSAPEERDALAITAVCTWLSRQLELRVEEILPTWEAEVGRTCSRIRLRHMMSRWGSCNVRTGSITLNTELAERPPACLDEVLCHELCHLVEPRHNARFHALMDLHCPTWRETKALLDERPLRRQGDSPHA